MTLRKMLQENVAPQPKVRQKRRLLTCGTSLSQNAVQDNKVVPAAGFWNPLPRRFVEISSRSSGTRSARGPGAGGESHALRLRSQGDLEPSRPDEQLHSVIVSEWLARFAHAARTGSRNLFSQVKGVQRPVLLRLAAPGTTLEETYHMVKRFDSTPSDARDVGGGGRWRWL